MKRISGLIKDKNNRVIDSFFFLSVLVPFLMALWFDVNSYFPFWYDNARDLTKAWENLHDPALIGPPSGIQGIFYGPYWIWALSVSTFFSKDPRLAVFLVGILPYFVVFPVLLYLFKKVIKKPALIVLWTFFIFNIGIGYATNLWNPHLAPLLLLLAVYLLSAIDFSLSNLRSLILFFLTGISAGLIINFHISLGLGVALGIGLFFLASMLVQKKGNAFASYLKQLFCFILGLLITFFPYMLFEFRNGFMQSKTFYNAIFGSSNLVGMEGLSQGSIILLYLGRAGDLLGLNGWILYIAILLSIFILIFGLVKRKVSLSERESKLLLILVCVSAGILGLYLLARNPVWAYHFIGVEIIFLLFFALVISKFKILMFSFLLFASFLFWMRTFTFYQIYSNNRISDSSLSFKIETVKKILEDSKGKEFSFYAYSPSIYIYEYSYLFNWLGEKEIPFDPGVEQKEDSFLYLVIPTEKNGEVMDFVNYRANPDIYNMEDKWVINDDIIILKYTKNEK